MTNLNYGKCLGCYHPISDGGLYHQRCCQKLFQQKFPPQLEISTDEVTWFAQKFLSQRLVVTGVQRKLSLALEKAESSRLTLVGSLGGGYIMKPPNPDYDQMPEIEDLSMHMAEACGIKTSRHGLLPMQEGGIAYITKRFDRKGQKKVAVEDMCQLSGLLTEQKYRSSYEQVAKLSAQKTSVDAQLAEPDIYDAANKAKLKQLLADQTNLTRELGELETEWLSLHEQLDALA